MGRVIFLAIAFAAMLATYASAYLPSRMETPQLASCVVPVEAPVSAATLAGPGLHWQCHGTRQDAAAQHMLVRFDLSADSEAEAPKYLRSRIGLFDQVELTVIDRDGTMRQSRQTQDSVRLISGEPMFLAELPEITPESRALFVRFDGARHDVTVLRSKLFKADPSRTMPHYHNMLFLALVLGMMLMPVVFDLAFWSALRSPFLLWHGALSLAFASMVLLRSGLVVEFVEISMATWRQLLIVSLGVAILVAAFFTNAFVEGGRLDQRLRKLLLAAGIWGFAASAIHALGLEVLAPLGGRFHTYALLPVLVAFIWAMADAYRRGSRSIRFQIVGWIPLLLAYSIEIATNVFPLGVPTEALPIFYIGVLSETTITAIGVADRFFLLRRERDQARTKAEALEQLSERDPLTGLHNRRAIDARFDELHRAGYETFALIDLDHFKPVNDTAGHLVGDEVLKVVARVIESDGDAIAMRMGGEEFLLVMRGKDAPARAEKLRNAIPIRVAQEVPELEQLVTASMGLLVAPRLAVPMANFADIYSRVDMLLYEAKAQGRNRTVSERLQAFERGKIRQSAQPDRRKRDRRKPRAA